MKNKRDYSDNKALQCAGLGFMFIGTLAEVMLVLMILANFVFITHQVYSVVAIFATLIIQGFSFYIAGKEGSMVNKFELLGIIIALLLTIGFTQAPQNVPLLICTAVFLSLTIVWMAKKIIDTKDKIAILNIVIMIASLGLQLF